LIIDLHIHIFTIKHCRFIDINSTAIIRTFVHKAEALSAQSLVAVIDNTSFVMFENAISVLLIENTLVILGGTVVFTKIVNHVTIVHLVVNSYIIISDHVAFSLNRARYCIIMLSFIELTEPANLDIIANNFLVVFYAANDLNKSKFTCLYSTMIRETQPVSRKVRCKTIPYQLYSRITLVM